MKFVSASEVMLAKSVKPKVLPALPPRGKGDVDIRIVRGGLYRYRFRLTASQLEIVNAAVKEVLKDTGYLSEAAALDLLGMSYNAGGGAPKNCSWLAAINSGPTERKIFKLYPDQHESLQVSLKDARTKVKTDAEALVLICAIGAK
jgi:hypothetical protein